MSLVAYYSDSSDDENGDAHQPGGSSTATTGNKASSKSGDDVLEDFVKKVDYGQTLEKPSDSTTPASGLSKMRLPAAKGKVKISIPALQDDDSDDDQPKPKKLKPSTGGTGFLSSLPAPKGALGGKELTRPLIPHTLTKAKPPMTTQHKLPKKASISKPKLTESYSDSDDEPDSVSATSAASQKTNQGSVNFFSLDDNKPSVSVTVSSTAATASYYNISGSASESAPQHQPKLTAASLYNVSDDVESYAGQGQMAEQYENQYNVGDNAGASNQDELMNNAEFQKLIGKKGKGREEINFIDINAEDAKASEIDLIKGLSEEVDPYSEKAKKGAGFSGKAKSKHQITWLAHQAKVREQELKNQWAANKHTRMQTQAKYGF